ncbi:ABC transporter permease [Sinorhizobium medicae]|uniref:Binding-protein-dependent transport systems inner membrane component n=1 Tax=Sinorhizobium medicae TaxID=110321 RepID=A0A508WZ83_9HYPH|nr:ABC transporter permease [Sinorhizobium medicae]MBO1944122.1 ABC transporter permease [Sinorhizobium medicae]MDX0425210.1 ABC transporter permease subunit [Sinorhizobium medicae]MDX0443622.1 ABC transporter permease subunit [Sinorhizobium medicae]MDX0461588.1 ABC transporter permease subunit [Sinorhizobium medicae]MDX0486294.1 ABC transporter permease subunit [Sinorhizobium medicae]
MKQRSWLLRHAKSFVLIAPLALFLAFFFVAPLVTMMKTAVSDPVASRALPNIAAALDGWDRTSAPPADAQRALVADIRGIQEDELFGDLVRRLNSAKSGFRTLMSKTRKAVAENPNLDDLISVDKRWSDPAFWIAVQDAASSPVTDRNLLAAVDLTRDLNGNIIEAPAGTSANRETLIRTIVMAGMVTICTVLIGLPFAMVAASTTGWKRQLLLGAVLLPLWTSLLVRTAAWYIILQDNGLINLTLQAIGLTEGPLPLIFNRLGVVIAMTHVLLPFMVLPIFSVLIGIPKNLMPAAASLGASPVRSFLSVLLPLSLRGVVSGSLLVFMSALGYYITPALIGGAKDQMISAVIAYYATGAANWGMAGALGIVLLTATIILYVVYLRLSSEEAKA